MACLFSTIIINSYLRMQKHQRGSCAGASFKEAETVELSASASVILLILLILNYINSPMGDFYRIPHALSDSDAVRTRLGKIRIGLHY